MIALLLLAIAGAAAEEATGSSAAAATAAAEAQKNASAAPAALPQLDAIFIISTAVGGEADDAYARHAAARRARLLRQLRLAGYGDSSNNHHEENDANNATTTTIDVIEHTPTLEELEPALEAAGAGTARRALEDPLRYARAAAQAAIPFEGNAKRQLHVAPPLTAAQRAVAMRYALALRRSAAAGHETTLFLSDQADLGAPHAAARFGSRLRTLLAAVTTTGAPSALLCLSSGRDQWRVPLTDKKGFFGKMKAAAASFASFEEDNIFRGPEAFVGTYLAVRFLADELLPLALPLAPQLTASANLLGVASLWAEPPLVRRAADDGDEVAFAAAGGRGRALEEAAAFNAAADEADGTSCGSTSAAATSAATVGALTAAMIAVPAHKACTGPGALEQAAFATLEMQPSADAVGEAATLFSGSALAGSSASATASDAGLLSKLLPALVQMDNSDGGGGGATLATAAGSAAAAPGSALAGWRKLTAGEGGDDGKKLRKRGTALLRRAAVEGRPALATALLRSGLVDATARFDGELELTAAMLAAKHGHASVLAALGGGGGGGDGQGGGGGSREALLLQDSNGATALAHAAAFGRAGAVSLLCSTYGMRVDRSGVGLSELHRAAMNGHAGAVRALLAHCGADGGAVDGAGNSPLAYAASEGHLSTAAALLAGGAACPGAPNADGADALAFAAHSGDGALLRLLQACGAGQRATATGAGASAGSSASVEAEAEAAAVYANVPAAEPPTKTAVLERALPGVGFGTLLLALLLRWRRARAAARCRAHLEDIYRAHAPEMLAKVDAIMAAYAGSEEEMLAKALAKYGAADEEEEKKKEN